MTFLQKQDTLQPQAKGFSKFLQKNEKLDFKTSLVAAKQMQDFTQSGMTPKEYFEAIKALDERGSEVFIITFRDFVQYQNTQYFEDFHKLRWENGRKYAKGGF